MEVLVGILSTLVTVLIGWQIYNVITFEKQINRKIKKQLNAFTKRYKKDQALKDQKISLLRSASSLKLLHIVYYQACKMKNVDSMCQCLTHLTDDIIEFKDIKNATIVYELLEDLIKHGPITALYFEKLETSLKELCKLDDVGFECLKLLEQLRPENQPVK